ncbi:hypothetical protein Godav_019994 [Gossypium davidsonii]|uniref:Uncharacterized protein n=1 Tax=Gossypium davidsonii TaxID=34287 RepID=A0A7J8R1L8_GOSDV|nr:hypothetical protein [Gossypium davidsonii]
MLPSHRKPIKERALSKSNQARHVGKKNDMLRLLMLAKTLLLLQNGMTVVEISLML